MPTPSRINDRRDTLSEAVDRGLSANRRLVSSKQINLVDNTVQQEPEPQAQPQAAPEPQETPEQQAAPLNQDVRFTPQQQMDRGQVTASSILDRLTGSTAQQESQQRESGRQLLAPVDTREEPQPFSGYTEQDMRPNDYDIQVTMPPVPSGPDIGQMRKMRAKDVAPSLESTVDMVLGTSRLGLPGPPSLPVPNGNAPEPAVPQVEGQQQQSEPAEPAQAEPSSEASVPDTTKAADDNVLEEGPSEKPQTVSRFIETPSTRFYADQDINQEIAAAAVADKHWNGHGFSGKASSDESVFPDAVAVGIEEIIEIIRTPGNNFLEILRNVTGIDLVPEQAITPEGQQAIREAVNSAAKTTNPIWIVATKSPDPNHYSSQSRRLMIKPEGRGVTIHPSQAMVYTMDFDGDDVVIQFAADTTMFQNPMELMISLDGKAMLDPKLFPVPRFASSLQDYKDRITEYILTPYANVIDKTQIVEALYYATYPEQIKDNRDPWLDLVRALDKEASKYSDHNLAMAGMLNNIFGTLTYIKRGKIAAENSDNLPVYSSGAVKAPADGWVALVIDEVAAGRLPMNVYDFENGYNKAMAEAEKQNVEFRLGQDLMKVLKTSKSTFVGSKEIAELYQLAVDAGYAMWCNGQTELGGKAINYTNKIRDYVLSKAGMPEKWKTKKGNFDVPKWLAEFKKSYNYIVGMMDAADITVDLGLDIHDSKDHRINSNDLLDFVTPLIKVYGEKTIDELFPGEMKYVTPPNGAHMADGKMLPRYKDRTVERYSQNNGIKVRYELLSQKRINSNCYPSDVLYALADHRRSQSSKFHKDYEEMLGAHTQAFKRIEKEYKERSSNWGNYIEDLTTMIHSSGVMMFQYYGMDDVSKFLNTEYGYKMREAADKGADELGGVQASLVFNYRLKNVTKINGEISRLMYDEKIPDIERIHNLRKHLAYEIDVLSSSSDLWEVIGEELNGNTSAYHELLETRGKALGTWTDARNIYWKHPKFGHNSLMDVLSDPDVPLSHKRKIAADVVRLSTKNYDLVKEYDMDYQLQIGPKPEYTSVSTMTYLDEPSILDSVQSSTRSLKSFFKKSAIDYLKVIKTLRAVANPGDLQRYIKRLVEDPQAYLKVDDYLFVDAIQAGMEKTTKSDEKGKVEGPIEMFYKSMKKQRGGFDNVMYRLDDSIVGRVGEGDISRLDLFMALNDPNFSMEVYDGDRLHLLNKETLCGGISEDKVWDFLEANPKLANMFIQHIATANGYSDIATTGTLADSMYMLDDKVVLKNKVKSFLFDDPMFASMVSLFVPKTEKTASMIREKTKAVANSLESLFIGLAKVELIDKVPINVEQDLLIPLGVTPEKLKSLGMEDQTADDYYEDLVYFTSKFIRGAERIIEDGGHYTSARRVDAENVSLEMDGSSARSAIDVRQAMVSGKISSSTEIEGGITARNQSAALYFASTKDRYTVIDELMTAEELAPFQDCMTNGGILTADILSDPGRLHDFIESVGPDPLVVEVPDGYEVSDGFVTKEGRPVSSVEVLCLHRRSFEAEEGNLQLKRSGRTGWDPNVAPENDVTSSITRNGRYMHDWKKNRALIDDAFNSGGIFAARLAYARILQSADAKAGYTYMDLANYMCIADEVIRPVENELGQTYTIVTLSQISDAVFKGLDPVKAFTGTPKEVIDQSVQVVNDVRNEIEFDSDAVVAPFLKMPTVANGQFRPAKKASMSFKDKNYKMQLIVANSETFVIPWTGEKVTKNRASVAPKKTLDKMHNTMAKQSVYGVKNSFDTEYRVIGRIGAGFRDIQSNSPGLKSVILIEPNATQTDVDNVLKEAYGRGMTVAFRDLSYLGDKADIFAEDIKPAPFSSELIMLPFFEMRMNGWSKTPPMAPASYPRDPGWTTVVVEDEENFYNIGDGEYLADKSAAERIKVVDDGIEPIYLADMFFNTNAAYPDQIERYEVATYEEVEATIINWQDEGPIIDNGLPESNRYEEGRMEKLPLLIEEFRNAWPTANDKGIIEYGKPDRIIGWMKCFVKGYSEPVWAPIIPFPMGSKLSQPVRFKIDGDLQLSANKVSIPWKLEEPLYGHYLKMLDGNGTSGKGGVVINRDVNLGALEIGRRIDFMVGRFSFDGRIEPGERRIRTLKTMTYLMSDPPFGYNFGALADSFPDNREVAEELQHGRISIAKWKKLYKQNIKFSNDKEIDDMLRKIVGEALETGTTNPSDILASKYDGAYSWMEWDMGFYFESNDEFQNAWMKFMNKMNDVCPPNINSFDKSKHIFKPIDSISDPNYGALMMRVPFPGPNGPSYAWRVVYVSMSKFTNDSTPLHKVGVNVSRRTMEQISAAAMSGRMPSGSDFRNYMRSTLRRSPQALLQPGTIVPDYSRYSRKVPTPDASRKD